MCTFCSAQILRAYHVLMIRPISPDSDSQRSNGIPHLGSLTSLYHEPHLKSTARRLKLNQYKSLTSSKFKMPAGIVCRDCAGGNLHSGTTTGRIETVHGLQSYVTDPPEGQGGIKGIIVIIPDAFGWELPNSRILAGGLISSRSMFPYH